MARFATFPDLGADVLSNDLARVSTHSLVALWEQLTLVGLGRDIGALVLKDAPLGTFGVWDYLVTTGDTLADSLRVAIEHFVSLGDPANETLKVFEDDRTFTIRHSTGSWGPDVIETVQLCGLALFATRATAAARRPVRPLRITLTQRAPRSHQDLSAFFDAETIVFDSPANSITFRADDVYAPLPGAVPGLRRVLLDHASLALSSAVIPPAGWLELFHLELESALRDGVGTLDQVAARLAMGSRTLQRRLAAEGTTWRAELDAARRRRAAHLSRTSDLPRHSVAARVGYSDARALRRAARRWEQDGRGPDGA
ncbi:AraC family transcriptional regulator ligand-binding domain-containing protein [Streptomyces sp. NPDC001941]|uniref:AraC family transcriptional regulator ligand-binding domain-containing protein n=1 Tax=Streptomyces sp. NPDC001941 TaxID=3154659 RepID=UPI003328D9F9